MTLEGKLHHATTSPLTAQLLRSACADTRDNEDHSNETLNVSKQKDIPYEITCFADHDLQPLMQGLLRTQAAAFSGPITNTWVTYNCFVNVNRSSMMKLWQLLLDAPSEVSHELYGLWRGHPETFVIVAS